MVGTVALIYPYHPQLLSAVGEVRRAVMVYPDEPAIPPPPDMTSLTLNGKKMFMMGLMEINDNLATTQADNKSVIIVVLVTEIGNLLIMIPFWCRLSLLSLFRIGLVLL